MSEHLDIMLANEELPYFTVDNTKSYVLISQPTSKRLLNVAGYHTFEVGDNFTILSYGIVLPLSFQLDRSLNLSPGTDPYQLTSPTFGMTLLAHGIITNAPYSLREVSSFEGSRSLCLIMENFDTAANIFINIQNQEEVLEHNIKDEPFYLEMTLYGLGEVEDIAVSMAGVPDSLNGTRQYITPYIKVVHNFPLTLQ